MPTKTKVIYKDSSERIRNLEDSAKVFQMKIKYLSDSISSLETKIKQTEVIIANQSIRYEKAKSEIINANRFRNASIPVMDSLWTDIDKANQ
jgi:alanine dehydrogenase